MYPKLFDIPFTNLTVWTYGLMIVIGFLLAVYIIRRLSRNITPDPQLITNAALYSLIAGVSGARLFYVIHYFDKFKDNLLSIFMIWKGGLELLGGVILAITVILLYLRYHKLPARRYLDILAIGLFVALAFGRMGCFMKGCCFGKPSNVPWAVSFPYASDAYYSQTHIDPKRDRFEPHLKLPAEFFGSFDKQGNWSQSQDGYFLKPFNMLTDEQKQQVTTGPLRCLPVHPTQLYSSANALLCSLLLFLFWRSYQDKTGRGKKKKRHIGKPGCTFALLFILYGLARFFLESLRDDNPYEQAWWIIYRGGTVSQNLGIYFIILGIILMVLFQKMKPDKVKYITPKKKTVKPVKAPA